MSDEGNGKTMAKIKAICISKQRGTAKYPVCQARLIENWGIEGDAHAGHWHRQVSLLSQEKVDAFRMAGGVVGDGAFGENLLVEGIDFAKLPVGTRFLLGEVILELTQIGKECHNHCAIYQRVGDCIMPREGVFAKVIRGGELKVGDEMQIALPEANRPLTAAVITLSDKGAAHEREDLSGPAIVEYLQKAGYVVVEQILIPDEEELLKQHLIRLADQRQVGLILTTGGTGFSQRDRTPEATLAVADRIAPGISEAIRAGSMQFTKRAMLGRGVSVLRKQTLIVNLPGSVKAVRESLDFVLDTLEHGVRLLQGLDGECARGQIK